VKYIPKLVFIGIIIVAMGIGYLSRQNTVLAQNARYAVTLNNERTYFGTITQESDKYVLIEDVYYMSSPIQNGDKTTITLVKLGEGTYTPQDKVYLNRDSILMLAPVAQDSKINDAITKYKKENTVTTPASASPSPSPQS
jgi:hypothetical protein